MDQNKMYSLLVDDRQACRLCAGLVNPSAVDNGVHDAAEVGPWTTWQGNLKAKVLLVGQDYSDVAYFVRNGGREQSDNPTDIALVTLFKSIGIAITPPGQRNGRGEVFFTNAILCLKEGGMQATVRHQWFRNCSPFLRRQVEIVNPRIVIALGARAFQAISLAFSIPGRPLGVAVRDATGIPLPNGSKLFAVYHCGRRAQNTVRTLDEQIDDWNRIVPALSVQPGT